MVKGGDWVAFDTETTDLDGEIISWAVVDPMGNVLGSGLVKPKGRVSEGATALHGITDSMLAYAPTFDQVAPFLAMLFSNRRVVMYNAEFDMSRVLTSARACGCGFVPFYGDCAMEA